VNEPPIPPNALREGLSPPPERPCVAPRIETERLILRPHAVDDFPDCVSLWRQPKVVQYTIGSESPPQRTWQRLLAYGGHWLLLGFGYWAVQCKATGRYIGELGFADFRRDFEPSIAGIPEIGWALSEHAHGRGYASEALREVLRWGDRHLSSTRTVCIIHRSNDRSIHLARTLGYSITLRVATDGEPHMLLARDSRR
jgi:RimJ/RimL family protein N-acetyltransferase